MYFHSSSCLVNKIIQTIKKYWNFITLQTWGQILNECHLKPHKVKQWIHTPVEDEEKFNAEVNVVCDIYHNAAELKESGTHVLSTDEKSGMQALEREITPMTKYHEERQDNSYERHGTQCLIANIDVAT